MAKIRNDLIVYTGDLVTDFVKSREGFVGGTYNDVAGLATAGYGHLITADDRKSGAFAGGMSEVAASKLLQEDISKHQQPWIGKLKVNIGQAGIAGLTGLAFNAGPGIAAKAVDLLNQGKTEAAFAFIQSVNKTGAVDKNGKPLLDAHGKRVRVVSKALDDRRKDEIAMIRAGLANATTDDVYAQQITQKGFNRKGQRDQQALAQSKAGVNVQSTTTVAQATPIGPSLEQHAAEHAQSKQTADLAGINAELAQIAQRLGADDRDKEAIDRLRREGSNAA